MARLKNKIQVSERYVRYLQGQYLTQTGVLHHPSGPLPALDLIEAVEHIKEDLAEARGL
jgi:hypothetical protein